MKQIFFLTLTLSILLLSACSTKTETVDVSSNTEKKTVKTVSSETNISISTTSSLTNTEIKTDQTVLPAVSSTSQATESTTQNTEKAAESSIPTKVEKQETTTQEETKNTTTAVITESTVEEEPVIKATASDCSIIADKVIEHINAFRIEEGTGAAIKLSGLTEYAQYRSQQLVTNFAHDTVDERAAATVLQYGEYIEPSLYGMTGEHITLLTLVRQLPKLHSAVQLMMLQNTSQEWLKTVRVIGIMLAVKTINISQSELLMKAEIGTAASQWQGKTWITSKYKFKLCCFILRQGFYLILERKIYMKNLFWIVWFANHTIHHFKSSKNTKSAYTKKSCNPSIYASFNVLHETRKFKQSNRLALGGVV